MNAGEAAGAAIADLDGIHVPDIVSLVPMVVGCRTLDHAVDLAEQIVAQIERMPLTRQAGDTIAIAVALLHYARLAKS